MQSTPRRRVAAPASKDASTAVKTGEGRFSNLFEAPGCEFVQQAGDQRSVSLLSTRKQPGDFSANTRSNTRERFLARADGSHPNAHEQPLLHLATISVMSSR